MIIPYSGNYPEVLEWLRENITHTMISPSGRSGFDTLNQIVFGVYATQPVVYFTREKDAIMFALRWS